MYDIIAVDELDGHHLDSEVVVHYQAEVQMTLLFFVKKPGAMPA